MNINSIILDGVVSTVRRTGAWVELVLTNVGKAKAEYFTVLTKTEVKREKIGERVRVLGSLGSERTMWRGVESTRTVVLADSFLWG